MIEEIRISKKEEKVIKRRNNQLIVFIYYLSENISLELNHRRIKSAGADLTSSWSMTDKEFNPAPEGREQLFSGLKGIIKGIIKGMDNEKMEEYNKNKNNYEREMKRYIKTTNVKKNNEMVDEEEVTDLITLLVQRANDTSYNIKNKEKESINEETIKNKRKYIRKIKSYNVF